MPSQPDGVDEGVVFSGFSPSVRLSRQILLPRYLMNGLSNLKLQGITFSSLLMTWLDFGGQRSRSQQVIEMAKVFASMLVHQSPSSSFYVTSIIAIFSFETTHPHI